MLPNKMTILYSTEVSGKEPYLMAEVKLSTEMEIFIEEIS